MQLTMGGIDGVPAQKSFQTKGSGHLPVLLQLRNSQRLEQSRDH